MPSSNVYWMYQKQKKNVLQYKLQVLDDSFMWSWYSNTFWEDLNSVQSIEL